MSSTGEKVSMTQNPHSSFRFQKTQALIHSESVMEPYGFVYGNTAASSHFSHLAVWLSTCPE